MTDLCWARDENGGQHESGKRVVFTDEHALQSQATVTGCIKHQPLPLFTFDKNEMDRALGHLCAHIC